MACPRGPPARLALLLEAVPGARLVAVAVIDPLLEAPKAGLFVLHALAVRVRVVVAALGRRVLEVIARLTFAFVTIPYARLVPVVVLDPFLVAREALVLVLNTMAIRLWSANRQVVEAALRRLVLEEGRRVLALLLDAIPLAHVVAQVVQFVADLFRVARKAAVLVCNTRATTIP